MQHSSYLLLALGTSPKQMCAVCLLVGAGPFLLPSSSQLPPLYCRVPVQELRLVNAMLF